MGSTPPAKTTKKRLYDPAASAPSFAPDRAGTFALSLVVDDGTIESAPDAVLVAVGPDEAQATIRLKPAKLRRSSPPVSLRALIELPEGFSAREIAADAAAIVAVGKKTLARPVARIRARKPTFTDVDRDGRPELSLHFPVKPLLKHLRAGRKTALTLKGPLTTWGRFVGSAALKILY